MAFKAWYYQALNAIVLADLVPEEPVCEGDPRVEPPVVPDLDDEPRGPGLRLRTARRLRPPPLSSRP